MSNRPKPAGKPVMIAPDAGKSARAFGEEAIFKLGGEETKKSLTLWMEITPPGGGTPPHYHLNEDELFLVQQGRVEFLVEGKWTASSEGSVVYVPRGNIHAFRNAGQTPSRMWVITTPSGFEKFFARCAVEFARPGAPDMNRIMPICAEHGIHIVEQV